MGNTIIGKKYRLYKTLFQYVLLMQGNQTPFYFWGGMSVLAGGLLHYFVGKPLAFLPFYGFGAYYFGYGIYDYVMYTFLKGKEEIPPNMRDAGWVRIMKQRKSFRSFQPRYITDEHEEIIKKAIADEPRNDGVELAYVKKKFTLVYCCDSWQHLVLVIPKKYTDEQIIQAGRSMFKVILTMYREGVSACVVGGFTVKEVAKALPNYDGKRDKIAVVIPFGYKSKKVPYFARTVAKFCRTRKPINKLFFENTYGTPLDIEKLGEDWMTVFDSARWVPSASNMQNTRYVKIGNKFHFYKQGVTNPLYNVYTRLNMGISMTAWSLSCEHVGIKGKFVKEDPEIELPGKHVKYYYTYEVEE